LIIDKTGRKLKPGDILDVCALTLSGPMIPVRIVEVYEPAGLTLPSAVPQEPPYLGVLLTLKVGVQQIANPNSREKVYICDNSYVVGEGGLAAIKLALEGALERVEAAMVDPGESNGNGVESKSGNKSGLKLV